MYGQRWPQRHLPPEPEPPGITLCVHERKDALSRLHPPHAAAICSGKAAGPGCPGCPRLPCPGWEGEAGASAGGLGAVSPSAALSPEPSGSAAAEELEHTEQGGLWRHEALSSRLEQLRLPVQGLGAAGASQGA